MTSSKTALVLVAADPSAKRFHLFVGLLGKTQLESKTKKLKSKDPLPNSSQVVGGKENRPEAEKPLSGFFCFSGGSAIGLEAEFLQLPAQPLPQDHLRASHAAGVLDFHGQQGGLHLVSLKTQTSNFKLACSMNRLLT